MTNKTQQCKNHRGTNSQNRPNVQTGQLNTASMSHAGLHTEQSREALVTTHPSLMVSCLGCHFHSYLLYTCTLKEHLAMKRNYYTKSLYQKYSCMYLDMGLKNRCMHCAFNRTRHLKRLRPMTPVQTE